MNLIQSFLTKNPCYTCGRTITPKGLMLHSVGCPQPSAAVFVRNWNKASYDRAGTFTRPFLGTAVVGIVPAGRRGAGTIPILGLKCVNRPVSSTRAGQPSPVLTPPPQKPL